MPIWKMRPILSDWRVRRRRALDRVVAEPSAKELGPRSSAATIGSIDIDAVFRRYKKVKVFSEEYNAALSARKNELRSILSEAQKEAEMLLKLSPASAEYKLHERRSDRAQGRGMRPDASKPNLNLRGARRTLPASL